MKLLQKIDPNGIEKTYLNSLEERLISVHCTEWVYSTIKWYSVAAEKNKRRYYLLTIIAIIIPLANFFITLFLDDKWISLLPLISSTSVSMLNLLQCQKKWTSYRSTLERLKGLTERYLCLDDYKYNNFIIDFENIVMQENKEWMKYVQTNNDSIEDNSRICGKIENKK